MHGQSFPGDAGFIHLGDQLVDTALSWQQQVEFAFRRERSRTPVSVLPRGRAADQVVPAEAEERS